MARTLRLKIFPKGSNPRKRGGPKPIVINVSGGSLQKAKARLSRFLKRHIKNVEMGFYRGGVFHPIRASKDYSRAQAGEGRARSYNARFARLRSATRRGTIRSG